MNENLTNFQKIKVKFISGFMGSLASLIVVSPIDIVRVRYQTSVIKILKIIFYKNIPFLIIKIYKSMLSKKQMITIH
jgi:hypothetical protein